MSPAFFVGIADGVGSLESPKKAKESANFAQTLMKECGNFLDGVKNNKIDFDINGYRNNSHYIASIAAEHVSKNKLRGSSTLCIVNIEHRMNNNNNNNKNIEIDCVLNSHNLGDSGFAVFRRTNQLTFIGNDVRDQNISNKCYEMIYKSKSQVQDGVPDQLGSHPTANHINDGLHLDNLVLKSYDIIVIGSDGLWDNLWDYEISELLCSTMKKYFALSIEKKVNFNHFVHSNIINGNLTFRLLKEAYQTSLDPKKTTPYSTYMTETLDMIYEGGKRDDMSCIIVYIH